MRFRQTLGNIHPELQKKYYSKQYLLSKEIIKKKLLLKVDQRKMASLMKLYYNQYLEMERGSANISIQEYEKALERIANISKEDEKC